MTSKRRDAKTQTGLLGWLRNNPNLDSGKHGIVLSDSDVWVHKYKTVGDRNFQFLMLLEVKEFGANLSDTQRDTLHIANQLLRNRKNKRDHQPVESDGEPRIQRVYSTVHKQYVTVHCYGVHSVRVDGDGTYAHWNRILWDNKYDITPEQLERLVRFELDPYDLSEIDHRPCGPGGRHKQSPFSKTVVTELGFEVEKTIVHRS